MMIKGTVPVTWTEKDFKELDWLTNDVHEEKFNAIVDTSTYDVGVSMCFENLPQVLLDVAKHLDLNCPVVAVNRMIPGKILPYHRDLFKSYKERNHISDKQPILRIIVFLEDTKAGHQLWIEEEPCFGPAGSYFGWGQNTVHMAANLGWEDRYIMQITGCRPNIVKEVATPHEGEVTLDATGNEVLFRNGSWYRI
jgi:hypothetical protein